MMQTLIDNNILDDSYTIKHDDEGMFDMPAIEYKFKNKLHKLFCYVEEIETKPSFFSQDVKNMFLIFGSHDQDRPIIWDESRVKENGYRFLAAGLAQIFIKLRIREQQGYIVSRGLDIKRARNPKKLNIELNDYAGRVEVFTCTNEKSTAFKEGDVFIDDSELKQELRFIELPQFVMYNGAKYMFNVWNEFDRALNYYKEHHAENKTLREE